MVAQTFTIHIKGRTTVQKRAFATDQRRLQYELGGLVRNWSNLQEQLAGIFHQATECPPHVANSIWHSLKSDLVQRELLLAALRSSAVLHRSWKDDEKRQLKVQVFEEYIWAIEQISKVAHRRNDLIHSPIIFFLGPDAIESEAQVSGTYDNPRAKALKDKELYQLARWLNAFCDLISRHLHSIWQTVNRTGSVPIRPTIKAQSEFPTRKQKPLRKPARRRKKKIAPSR